MKTVQEMTKHGVDSGWIKLKGQIHIANDINRLPSVFIDELKTLFDRLSDDILLKRCLAGHTQNQNESINGVLWSRCPKTKFCGSQKVKLAVCETICYFNTGAASKASLLTSVGIEPGVNALSSLRKEDNVRISNAEKKNLNKNEK